MITGNSNVVTTLLINMYSLYVRGVVISFRNLYKKGEEIGSRIAFGYSTNLVLADVSNLNDK